MTRSITRADIDRLLALWVPLTTPGRAFLERDQTESPYPDYCSDVLAFFEAISEPQWSDRSYDPAREGRSITSDAFVARASLDQIRSLLTFCSRGERFGDGHWLHMLASGRIAAIMERLQILRESSPP